MIRSAWWAVLLSLAWSSVALAQVVPPPPAAYASASVAIETVLEPLAIAAEADLGRGEAALAMARVQVVMAEVPATSALHVRAEGLALLAQQRLGEGASATILSDDAYAPLVNAAADDVGAGRVDLARARLAWALAHVPPQSALGLRATSIQMALDARGSVAPATTPGPVPGQVVVQPSGAGWVTTPPRVAPAVTVPADPNRPRHRTDVEMVDLYVTAGLMGAYLGAWVPESSGLLASVRSDDQVTAVTLSMVLTGGVLVLGAFGLDQIGDGPRMGQPGSITAGIRFGFVLGGLTLGVLAGSDRYYDTAAQFDVMGVGLLSGAALGTIFAYAAEPHPAQVQFTQSTGVWGGILGAELAALVAPLAFPNYGASHDRMQAGFGITLGALSTGIVAGMLVSAAHANFSARRSWLMTLGLVAGTGAATAIWSFVGLAQHGNFDGPLWGGMAGVGGLAGLILVGFLTDGDHGDTDWDQPPPVQVSIAPTLGGGTLSVNGSF